MATTKKNTGPSLATRTMLVSLTIGFWEGRKRDKDVTDEVLDDKNAQAQSGSWWTRLVTRGDLAELYTAMNKGRRLHDALTLPWQNDGTRILPAAMFMKYRAEMQVVKVEFEKATENFLARYPSIVAKQKQKLGKLFKSEYFPTVTEIRDRYIWRTQINPLPDASDFRVDLGVEATEEIQDSIRQQNDETMQRALRNLWERLHTVLAKVGEKMAEEDGIFRDSLFENVKELCDLLPALNVTNDPALEKARKEIVEKVCSKDPEVIRTSKAARADTANATEAIMKKMAAFMGKAGA